MSTVPTGRPFAAGSVTCLLLLAVIGLSAPCLASTLVLIHGRIYLSPTEPPIEDGTIVMRDGRIQAFGPSQKIKALHLLHSVTTVDCRGMTITAGFWNSHVHFITPGLMQAEKRSSDLLSAELDRMFTRWGFTTVFDILSVLDNTNNIRRRIARGEVRGPRILTVGEPFFPLHGTPIYLADYVRQNHLPSAEVDSIPAAVARARSQIKRGADGVKLFTGAIVADGVLPMRLDLAKAIADEAHRAGKPVFAHPTNDEGLEVAIQSGVDILAHTAPTGSPWTAEFTSRLKAGNMALIPTLTLWDVVADDTKASEEAKQQWVAKALQQLQAYSNAGGQILFGTDAGYIHHYDTSEELTRMAAAGMTWQQILASLTTNPAQRFGFQKRSGHIARGMDADLVVLNGDPAKDITAFSKVNRVIRAGRQIYPNY